MGNGCLKPSPRTGQIYIDCINKIYQEVRLFQNQPLKQDSDKYSVIKQKIQKKGWLRKLMDNLTSHRQSISEAALHNYRLMTQTKGTIFKITGLIVIDYIVTAVLKESGLELNDKMAEVIFRMIKQKDINAESQYQQSEYKRQSLPQNKSPVLLTTVSMQRIQSFNNESNPKNNLLQVTSSFSNPNNSSLTSQSVQTYSLMLRQIYNVKFSNIFYNMIHSLISTEDSIYLYGIKSIITYTRFHTVKNIQQEKITDLLQILLQHIQTGQEINLTLQAYQMLLHKLKESFLQSQIKHFKTFLKIWEHSFYQTNNEQNSQLNLYLQNKFLLQKIIHKMIVSMIGSVGVNKIYEQIILFYDQHSFERMVHFEQMLISITRKEELKSQFFRGLYSFLLSYLAVCRGNGMGQSLKNLGSKKQLQDRDTLIRQKWPFIHSSKSYQAFISQYENILEEKVKRAVVGTLKRWLREYRFIEIDEIIKYNLSLMLNSFLFNIHMCFLTNAFLLNLNEKSLNGGNERSANNSRVSDRDNIKESLLRKKNPLEFAQYLSVQFCQQFCRLGELQQRISVVNSLYDETKRNQIGEDEKMMYLSMVDRLLYQEQIESMSKTIQMCQVDLGYSKEINLQIINQSILIVNKLTQKMLIRQIDHICYFLFSLFDLLSRMGVNYSQGFQLLTASIKFIQSLEKVNGPLIVLAFTQRMVKAISNQMQKSNFFLTWDLVLNCSYLLLSTPRNFNRQQSKKTLNQVYIKMTVNQQLKVNSHKYQQHQIDERVIKILLDNFGNMNDLQLEEQTIIKVELPKHQHFQNHHHLTGSHQKIYQLSSIAFRDMFNRGVSRAKGGFFPPLQEQCAVLSQNGGFSRANSIIREEDIGHQQKSIADVMDMINL